MNFIEHYERALRTKGYCADRTQWTAAKRLQHCYDEWVGYQAHYSNLFKRWMFAPNSLKGVYLWGGVGRGKSFLMDSFYACVPMQNKIRVHFHQFMREVHRQLKTLAGKAHPLNKLAQRIAKYYRLICFDEFHLSDIGDAMLLHRLLDRLFNQGVQFVMTSNYQPAALYPQGLHRDRILPMIALIQQKFDILQVDHGVDYRQYLPTQRPTQKRIYYAPLDARAHRALQEAFEELAAAPDEDPRLRIEQREICALRCANSVIWFDFMALCGTCRSQNDYLELASGFHTMILSDVPQITPQMALAARRFTWLIDVLYDHKVKFLMSAAVPIAQLYAEWPVSNELARTVSRLIEMQSNAYLSAPWRGQGAELAQMFCK